MLGADRGLSLSGTAGFEPQRWNRCLSLRCVMCLPVEVSASGRSLVQGSPTVCVCVCVCVYARVCH